MLKRLANIFRKGKSYQEGIEDLPISAVTSQKSTDTERPAFFFQDRLIVPPFDLNDYLNLYVTDSLAKALIDADTNLTVSPIEPKSETDELDSYVNEFNRRIQLNLIAWQLQRDANLYGFGLAEIIGDGNSLLDSRTILGVKRLDPRFILIEKTLDGRYKFFRQRPGLASFGLSPLTYEQRAGLPLSFDRPLDPQSIIFVQNWSPLTSYGHSLLQSCKARLTQRNELINAAVMAAKNHANPICMLMHELPAEMVVDDKLTRNERRSLKEQAKLVDNGQSRWVVGVGHGKYTIATVGHTALPNSTDLLDRLTQDIITSCGLSPSSMGMHLGSGKGVTTFNSSNQMTINTIVTKQRNLIQQLQLKLYSILPLIETATPPGEICIKMQEPTAESVKEKYEAESIKIDNAIMLGKAGVISGETAAHELGYDELEDNDKWQKMTEPQLAPENPNDPNTQQQKRAAITNAKKPGNNPAGSKN